jgi:hypothetical protein
MADLVRFESSRDVLAVKRGGVVNVEPGGQISAGATPLIPPPLGTTDGKVLTAKASAPGGADWEAGGGGGSSTLAALTDVHETSPADGDLLAYDAGSGKWVNSGNLKIGFQVSRVNFVTDGTYQTVDFPGTPGDGFVYWANGWTLADDNQSWNTPLVGRYLVGMTVNVPQDPTHWLGVLVSPPCSASVIVSLPPASVIDLSALGGLEITHVEPTELLHLPDTETFAVQVIGAVASIQAYCWIQYLGPATSL